MTNLKRNKMDHVVYLDAKARELENLILGNKSMIIRGASGRKLPYGRVNEGDTLYFINNNGEGEVKARGIVSSVFNSEELSKEESFETIIRNQDKLQLPDKQFDKLAGKRYLVLIGMDDIEEIEPFRIDKSNFTNMDDWIPVGKIEDYACPVFRSPFS
jgi:hypothetical protein